MSGAEIVHLSDSARNARASELERSILKIIEQSFTPADANRNPVFTKKMEELARLRNHSLPSLYQYFNVPLSGDLRRQSGSFFTPATTSTPKVTEQPALRRQRYTPSAEAQAIIDSVHKNKNEGEAHASEGVVISGKIAETLAKAALDLISDGTKPKGKPQGRQYFDKKADTGKTPEQKPVYQAGQTAHEERVWKDITSRGEKRPTPKPTKRAHKVPAEKRTPAAQITIAPETQLKITQKETTDVTTVQKTEGKREKKDRERRETTERLLREGKSVAEIYETFRISRQAMYVHLKKWNLGPKERLALGLQGQKERVTTHLQDSLPKSDSRVTPFNVRVEPVRAVALSNPVTSVDTLSMETIVKEMLDENFDLPDARVREYARFLREEAEKGS